MKASAATKLVPKLLRQVRDEQGHIAPDRVARAFCMSRGQLAETMGLAAEAIYKSRRREAPKTQARLLEMLEILARVSDWAGSEAAAMAWYRSQPLAALGDRTAESLVKTGQATLVRDYLDHLALGNYA